MLEENWDIVSLFRRAQTQWVMGFNGPIGLNYVSVEIVSRTFDIPLTAELLNGLQIMENVALMAMRSK